MIQTKTLILFTMLAGANASDNRPPRALSRNLITSAAEQVEEATTAWVRAVTKKNNPRLVAGQSCSERDPLGYRLADDSRGQRGRR